MAEENKWTDNAEQTEDSSDYHVTTSQHARQQKTKVIVKSKAAVAVVVTRKQRVRRKATNTLNQKLIVKKHAQQYVAVKAENVKVLRCSKASRSQLRPLTVTL